MRALLNCGKHEHSNARGNSNEHSIQKPQQSLLQYEVAPGTCFQVTQCHTSQCDCESLTAGVAGLPGEHGQKDCEYHQLVDRVLEDAHDSARQKCGQQIQLQPWMAKLQTSGPGS